MTQQLYSWADILEKQHKEAGLLVIIKTWNPPSTHQERGPIVR